MLLLFFPLFVANVIAACLPVPQYPPWGRRCLLYLNLLAIFAFVVQSFRPPTYSEWGMGDGSPDFRLAAVLLFLSSLPVAWRSFHRGKRLCLPLVLHLLLSPVTVWAQTNVPAVKPETLAAFMEKWKTYQPMVFPMDEADRPLIVAALAKDPAGPWVAYLISQAAETSFQLRQTQGPQRKSQAAAILPTLNDANALLTKALAADPTNTRLRESKEGILHYLGVFSLEAGEALGRVRALAQTQLDGAKATNHWNYGNIIYQANELLGRVALRQGKTEEARRCLRAAGRTPGSPQLNSFGPQFTLARELLEHGEHADREAVVAFLDDVATFWAKVEKSPGRRVAEDKLKELDTWRQEIRDGKIPDHFKRR
jgi:hypothetical protein